MSISTVKNNMFQSYSSCTILESHLNQLITILNRVDDSTANIVSQFIPTVKTTINMVKRNFDRMLQVNKVELHILFSEFNKRNSDMIMKLDKLSSDLDRLSKMATELYELYKLSESMEFYLEYSLSADKLRNFIPSIVEVKNELQTFKMMIDTNNKKLKVGVRR